MRSVCVGRRQLYLALYVVYTDYTAFWHFVDDVVCVAANGSVGSSLTSSTSDSDEDVVNGIDMKLLTSRQYNGGKSTSQTKFGRFHHGRTSPKRSKRVKEASIAATRFDGM